MSQIFALALSGMQAAQAKFGAAADNLANADTPGYKASRVDLVELSGGGVGVAGITKDPSPGPLQPDGREGSNVDIAREAINLTRAKVLYTANAALVRMGDRMSGTLLDMMDTKKKDRD